MPDIFDAASLKKPRPIAPEVPAIIPQVMPDVLTPPSTAETTVTPKRPPRPINEYSQVMCNETPTRNPVAAFSAMPSGVFFDTQEPDETVLLLLRRHIVTQIPWVATALVLILVPFLFSAIHLLNFLPGRFQLAAAIGWYLLILGYSLQAFLSWFYNVYIVTDQRIIDVDFFNLLYKNISAAKIENIEDVTTQSEGVFSSIFNYGTITIQTAATIAEFEFEDVPQPAKVTALINELLTEKEREREQGGT